MELDLHSPFRASDALRHGIPRADLIGPRFRRLLHGCYVAAEVPVNESLLVRAAMRSVPGAQFVAGHTAARLHGLPVPDTNVIHLGTTRSHASRRRQVHVHRYASRPELMRRGDLVLTSPRQTMADLATTIGLVQTVMLGDAVLRNARQPAGWLVDWLDERAGRVSSVAQQASRLCSPLAESPPESLTRIFFHLSGFPPIQEQIEVMTRSGCRRVDGGYHAAKIGIEYDGRHHIERQGQWLYDIGRGEDLAHAGWLLIRLTARDLHVTPQRTHARVIDAMVQRGMPRPRLSEEWRLYFPGRVPGVGFAR